MQRIILEGEGEKQSYCWGNFTLLRVIQGRRSVFCIEGANKQAPERQTCRGFRGNSPPENSQILKLANATLGILDEISKKINVNHR